MIDGDRDETKVDTAVVFSSERRAESAMDDFEEFIEDDDEFDAEIDFMRVAGDILSVELTVYDD